jgi:hypothetical protein
LDRVFGSDRYLWFVGRWEKEDADPAAYEEALWDIIDEMRNFAPDEVREQPLRDMRWARDPEVRRGVRPVIADCGHAAQFLASRGLALTNKAQGLFLDRVLDNYEQALLRLERRAKGDYSPDELPKSFPSFARQVPRTEAGPTPQELFEEWVTARQPAHSTVESWRTVFSALGRAFPDRSAALITAEEGQQWLDKLITDERSAFTVRNTWLRATKTVYAWAVRRRKLAINPFLVAALFLPDERLCMPKATAPRHAASSGLLVSVMALAAVKIASRSLS